jgi:RNA polymerase sigma-54 factor
MGLSQTIAPQMQQSLHMLQIPTVELRQLVQQELQINPILEEVPVEEGPENPSETPESDRTEAQEDEKFDKEFEELSRLDEEWRDYFSQMNTYTRRSAEDDERRRFFFDSIVQRPTLQEHLLEQLKMSVDDEDEKKIGELIIGNIDTRGYLAVTDEELTQSTGSEPEKIREMIALIQTFDPIGVAARDLRECLLIQLRRLRKTDELVEKIIQSHLDDLGKKKYPEIARALRTNVDEIQKAANMISTLDPQPGRAYSSDLNPYIAPDVYVQKVGEEYVVLMNDREVPHLRISNTYKDLLAQRDGAADVRSYVREKIRAGKFIIKSIHQRQQTIRNISEQIVRLQKEFFDQGPSALKPLTMAEVAKLISVHETTVSRAIANKYMQTPHGLFEMKYFFTSGYQTANGETMSSTSVKKAITEIIAKESPSKPLSDQEILEALKDHGIPIARRTVAKYREELKILPSHLRKKF